FGAFPGLSFSGTCAPPATAFWAELRIVPKVDFGNRRSRISLALLGLKDWKKMKKVLIALAALAAVTGSASAADLGARPYTKAPMAVAPAYNWTGFYIFGGGGGGLWAADSNVQTAPGAVAITRDQRLGGSGWFGTVGIGYDWQFNGRWVAGIFGDGQFGDIRGSLSDPFFGTEGREKLKTSYAAGVRVGYLVAPNVLSYVNGGYSGSEWSGTTQSFNVPGGANVATTGSFQRNG